MKNNTGKSKQHAILVIFCGLIFGAGYSSSFAKNVETDSIDLQEYLQQVKASHPYFRQQAFNIDINRKRQQAYLGDQDWEIKASSRYSHTERSSGSVFIAEQQDVLWLNAGAERHYWFNGSRLSIDYDYTHSSQKYIPPNGTFDDHVNGLSVTYTIPLMKNKDGILSRLEYEVEGYTIGLSELNSGEIQEEFLQQQGLLFLDWVFVTEQRRIATNRLALAEEEFNRTNKKRISRLVAEVDVLRTKDAVINAKQNLASINSQWWSMQAELATHSANPGIFQKTPSLDLYTLVSPPAIEQALQILLKNSRQLRALDIQMLQIDRMKIGVVNQLDPQLDLMMGAGLRSDDDTLSGAAKFDQPQYMFGVNFRYPLGARRAKADVSRLSLQKQQLTEARKSVLRQLEAQLHNLLLQLNNLRLVIALNIEQIDVAERRTEQELKRNNQGRSELSFVIQSRDNEQNAQLTYAANAAHYQKLMLRFEALTDSLLPQTLTFDSQL